jgi:type IV pilus assembly protein PilE
MTDMLTVSKRREALRRSPGHGKGFTLIEVMIVIVVVAILMAVAIPSYREYVLRSHRSSAQAFMSTVANRQAQYLLDARAYAGSIAALGLTVPADVAQRYDVTTSPVLGTPPGFLVTAAPIGGQVGDRCGQMTIDQTGLKSASAVNSSVQCW